MRITIGSAEFAIEALAQTSEAHDQTLDTFSCALEANSDPLPYAPMQTATVTLKNGEELDFIVESDSVDLYSLNPPRYKHSLTLIERARILAKHIVRNTAITQPAKREREASWSNMVGFVTPTGQYPSPYPLSDIGGSGGTLWGSLSLKEREKPESAWIQIGVSPAKQASAVEYLVDMQAEWFEAEDMEDINAETDYPLSLNRTLKVQFKLGNTTLTYYPTIEDLTGTQNWKFGRKYPSAYLLHLFSEGATEITIAPQSGGTMITGTQNPYEGTTVPFIAQEIKWGVRFYYYTAYDVLNLLIERQKQDTDEYQGQALFSLPQRGELYDLLSGTIAPDYTFTQSTMFECVMEVFRLFDAVFTISADGELGISYLNERTAGQADVQAVGRNSAIGEERRANGLISLYQDARQEESFPSRYGFAYLRGADYGVASRSDHNFIVAHPIHSVTKAEAVVTGVTCRYSYSEQAQLVATFAISGALTLDVSNFVFEEGAWAMLDPGTSYSPSIATQANSICYAQGDDKIQCGYTFKTTFGTTVPAFHNMLISAARRASGNQLNGVTAPAAEDWKEAMMRVDYIASTDGRVRSESIEDKGEGEMFSDQANGAVDLSKMSLNMMGLNMKLGEPTLLANVAITSWNDRIRKGQILQYQGSEWVANVCTYQFLADETIKGTVEFVKNYNSIASRIRVKSERRFSEISARLTQMSEDNYIEYIHYSTSLSELNGLPLGNTAFTIQAISTAFYQTFAVAAPILYITYAALNRTGEADQFYIPKTIYGGGNAICVEMQFRHPLSAGNQTKSESGWFGQTNYWTKPVYYADDDGFMDSCDIRIYAQGQGSFTREFPKVTPDQSDAEIFSITGYKAYKQPNEVFGLNYQLVALPTDKSIDFLSHHFMESNALCGKGTGSDGLILYWGDEPYSVLDTDGKGQSQAIADVSYGVGSAVFYIAFSFAQPVTASAWSVCDSRGKILFASNRAMESAGRTTIYFGLSHSRK